MNVSKLTAILVVLSLPLAAELSIKNIEKMVRDIRAKRTSKLSDSTPVISPFIVIKQDENVSVIETVVPQMVKTDFTLGAIVNDAAFIDGAWKRKGDTVGEFHVETIADDHVVLKRKNRTITLYFRKAKDILKIGKE